MIVNRTRFVRKNPIGNSKALLTRCFTSPDNSVKYHARTDLPGKGKEYYIARTKRQLAEDAVAVSNWDSNSLWSLPAPVFDHAVVNRLTALAEHDKELAVRVEHYYTEMTKGRASEREAMVQDVSKMQALIDRYDQLLTNPAQPLSASQEKRYLESQAIAERDLEKTEAAIKAYDSAQPNQFIPAFYRILGEAPGDFWNLDTDRQRKMLRLLVDKIEVDNISPHLYSLRLKWKDPVAQPWDGALIFRRNAIKSDLKRDDWSEAEIQLLREMYPTANKFDLHKAFPMRSGTGLKSKAKVLRIFRAMPKPKTYSTIYRSLCYADWVNACSVLGVDHETEEGETILQQLNYFAKTTESRSATFWWLLPVMELTDFDETLTLHDPGTSIPCVPG
jgi:hypothetical protein